MKFFYHASHEQFSPSGLTMLARCAEDAGFDGIFSSDHLQPWIPSQGQAGFIWSWLGAALASTRAIPFAGITTAGDRFHPIVIAQALATLAEMFPGRVPWFALGSGEALNEVPLGRPWPVKAVRQERMREAFGLVRDLLAGDCVTATGLVKANSARLWTLPATPPRLFGAAITAETAGVLGGWADGLLTVGIDAGSVGEVINSFRMGGGANKPVHLKVDLCLGATDDEALAAAHDAWRPSALPPAVLSELTTPRQFDEASAAITPEDMTRVVITGSSPSQFVARLRPLMRLGIDAIDLHHVGPDQTGFIKVFGRDVLPRLR